MTARERRPGFLRHLLLLWELRLALRRGGLLGTSGAWLVAGVPSLSLSAAAFMLLSAPEISASEAWPSFFLGLAGFVTTGVWCTWPVLSAGVDDHAELSRYAAFPLSPLRLLIASSLAELVTPIALLVHGPFLGALLGYAWSQEVGLLWVVPVGLAYLLFNAAWGRVALHLVLDVLRRENSGSALGGGLALLVAVGVVMPPVDVSWLSMLEGLDGVGPDVVARSALALSRVPTGYPGEALRHLADGRAAMVALECAGLLYFAAIGAWLALRLLVKFHHRAARVIGRRTLRLDPFRLLPGRFGALVAREAVDLWNNPRARMLASVPFLLSILLGLLSGRELFVHFIGESADGWMMTSLALYSAVLFAATFGQNAFGYDGHGLGTLWAAPLEPGEVLRAKNLVTGTAAVLLSLSVIGFYRLYFRAGTGDDLLFAALAAFAVIPVLLGAGNFLSSSHPARFDVTLRRRNRQPVAASLGALAAAGIGSLPAVLALRLGASGRVGLMLAAAVAAWILYAALLPRALSRLHARRESVLTAVTRE